MTSAATPFPRPDLALAVAPLRPGERERKLARGDGPSVPDRLVRAVAPDVPLVTPERGLRHDPAPSFEKPRTEVRDVDQRAVRPRVSEPPPHTVDREPPSPGRTVY